MKTRLLTIALLFFTTMGLMAQISGTVTNSSTQAAVANQTVYLQGDSMSNVNATTTTNANGQYSFANVGTSYYYDVYTFDCNQSYVGQTVYSTASTVNLSICVGSSSSCQAAFISSPDSTNANLINFFDNSTGNPTSWTWNFGDGISSNLQNPSHTYANAGTYTVTLSISSALCSDSTTNTITISNGNPSGCQAAFYSVPDSSNANLIMFFDNSTGTPTSWTWSFGDGTSSNLQNPTHTYTSGTYTVTLSISGTNCQSTATQTIAVAGGSQNYSISGLVLAGSNGLDFGSVQLYAASNGAPVATSSLDSNSGYYFGNVAPGNYLVFAVPSSNSIYTTFAATYYINDILWSSATTLSVGSNQSNINILLFQIVPMIGTGSVSGNLGTGVKGAVSGAVVNLLNSSNNPVASTVTDVNGDYSFSNVANGTYKIWAEIAGKTTTPIIVTIDASNQNTSNNDFVVKNNTVVPKTVSINNSQRELQIKTYPNPVEDQLNIALSVENNTQANIEIYNLAGQLLQSNNYDLQAGSQTIQLNISDLPQGSYLLHITTLNNGVSTHQLISKIK